MGFTDEEQNALHKAKHWMRSLKKETMLPDARHAYHAKLQKHKKEKWEANLGLSSNQQDQNWIDKSKAIQQKISKTRVHSHKSPP